MHVQEVPVYLPKRGKELHLRCDDLLSCLYVTDGVYSFSTKREIEAVGNILKARVIDPGVSTELN